MPEHRQGVTPSDLIEVRNIFVAEGISVNEMFFRYQPAQDRWTAWRVTAAGNRALIAGVDPNLGWIVVP